MTFKRKLFYSFLILAFLPTTLLIILSYYLATESSEMLAARGVSESLAAGDSLAMWVLGREQQQLNCDFHDWLAAGELSSASAVAVDSRFEFVIEDDPDSTSYRSRLDDSTMALITAALDSVIAADTMGRMLLAERLLIWQRGSAGKVRLTVGRFIADEFFQLAGRVVEGQTRFRSFSRTLLPLGQDLLLKISIALIAVALILSLLAAQMLSYSTSAPLGKLVEATRKISAGDLKYRIPQSRRDEIGTLIDNFNSMTEKLQTTTDNLVRAEREMTWRETARTIAHEIKNLLTPVNIALFKIRRMLGGSESSDLDLEQSVEALSGEVDAIADLARQFALFAHPPRLNLTTVPMTEVIDEVLALYRDQASSHEIEVDVSGRADSLSADRDLLRRALSNLVRNSLEATPYGGKVRISVACGEKGATVIEVRDDGPGADEAIDLSLPYVTTKKSGTGLGLAIVKKVCEAHGWDLSFGNAETGFVVTITTTVTDDQ